MKRGDLLHRVLCLVLFLITLTACELPPDIGDEGNITFSDPGEIVIIDDEGFKSLPEGTAETIATTEEAPIKVEDEAVKVADEQEGDITIVEEEPSEKAVTEEKTTAIPRISPEDLVISPEKSLQIWTDMKNHSNINFQALGSHPSVSRDGSLIAFTSNMNSINFHIYVRKVNAAITNFVQITSGNHDNLFPEISPDGKSVAFCNNKNGNFDIFISRIDNPVSQMQLTFSETDEISPSWSPDGKKIVFCFKNTFNVWQLAVVEIATRVISYLGPGMFPKWNPNAGEDWIVYQAQPTTYRKTWGIWIVKSNGTMLQQIVSDPEDKHVAFNPNWSPDGNWIVYSKSPQQVFNKDYLKLSENIISDLYVIRKDGTMETHLTETILPEWYPTWSGKVSQEDGMGKLVNDRIFFVSYKDRFQNIFSVKPPLMP